MIKKPWLCYYEYSILKWSTCVKITPTYVVQDCS